MCARGQVDMFEEELDRFMRDLRAEGELIRSRDIAPTQRLSIIRERDGRREAVPAIWWLLLDENLKPNTRFASFNTRSDKLHQRRSLGYIPYRQSRCIIPLTAIIEGKGEGKSRVNHMIQHIDGIIVCGGLYKTWLHRETGELVNSCSIITLPPVAGWEAIHDKAMPLMLPQDNPDLLRKWLDPTFQNVEEFQWLLEPVIRHPQRVVRIGKVSKWDPVGEPFTIPAQAAA